MLQMSHYLFSFTLNASHLLGIFFKKKKKITSAPIFPEISRSTPAVSYLNKVMEIQ